MTQALVTIVAPVDSEKLKILPDMIDKLGNPAVPNIEQGLQQLDNDGESGVHFASLHAIPAGDGRNGYLIFEFSADGDQEQALERFDRRIGASLAEVFAQSSDWRDGSKLLPFLRNHVISIGFGLLSAPGVAFAGTPGMTVGRIRKERDLAAALADLLAKQPADVRAIDRLAQARAGVVSQPKFAWALQPPPSPLPDNANATILSIVPALILDFVTTFLWPIGLVILLWVLYAGIVSYMETSSFWSIPGAFWDALWKGALIGLGVFIAIAGLLYVALVSAEARDWVDERWPNRDTLHEILKRENFAAQNHMVSVTRRKPGIVRWFTIRLVFWLVTEFVARLYKPGFLSDIGTIHFARWITVPGTRDFMFFSNYGGSWESYLEDFITRAHFGLTGIWSNSIGFPRSSNLVEGGASDGERFKRYARASMLPTRFWYSAYKDVTTENIRTNSSIRRGFASALTNEEALNWLALFGSAARPDEKMENSDIQSLVFGGLGFLPCGVCLLYRLPDATADAQAFIKALLPDIAFNDGRRLQSNAVITLGLGPKALAKLGLPEDCVNGFPVAFQDGMAARARILGDIDENDVGRWSWGGDEILDVTMLIYGTTDDAVRALDACIAKTAAAHGAVERHRIGLVKVEEAGIKREPFGFADGISQPLIRGTYKSLRNPDSIHIVEPGEFLLGYPDNRGNIPPGPTLSPLLDPHNRLPIAANGHDFSTNIVNAPRELGRNGTFLVIRQLAQDVERFNDYCHNEAKRLRHRLGPPYHIDADFIGAKLVGRWQDGSSLVRHPYQPRSNETSGEERLRAAQVRIPDPTKKRAEVAPLPAKTVSRPVSNPKTGSPIAPALGANRAGDNDFLFGAEDPEALRCPFGAHIRRANPRDSFDPGSKEQIDISNRHRMIRVGRFYDPKPDEKPGLLFMCLNGDIERQFEFTQQSWLNSTSFHGLSGEQDPVVGGDKSCTGFLVPSRDGPVRLEPLKRFVTTRGGGYFFLPSRRLLQFLSGDV